MLITEEGSGRESGRLSRGAVRGVDVPVARKASERSREGGDRTRSLRPQRTAAERSVRSSAPRCSHTDTRAFILMTSVRRLICRLL